MKEHSEEMFFVQVKEPNEVRKNLLQTLREIVEVLKSFEKFRQIRHEKLENINKLRILLKDANKMLGTLRSKLPQTNLKAAAIKEVPKQPENVHHKKGKKVQIIENKTKKAPKKEMTEADKLEAQLSAIEEKLKGLT